MSYIVLFQLTFTFIYNTFSNAFRSFSISLVGRKGNEVAHLLAKHVQGVEQYVAWIKESPCFLEHALSTDVLVSSLC